MAALGALLIMLVPPALYIAYATKRKIWWVAATLVVVGAFSTVSRTTVVMVFAVALVFVLLRPTYARRFWPALIPVVLAIHFAVPGTLGTLKSSLFPKGGLIASQKVHPDSQSSAGRIADIGPSLHELAPKPLFGLGLGTRITTGPSANDRLLDDQWLGSLLDTGIAGIVGWVWLILRFIRSLAEYERLSHEVIATEAKLRDSLFGAKPAAEVLLAYDGDEPAGFAVYFGNYSTFLANA